MDIVQLLQHPIISQVVHDYKQADEEKEKAAYNIFSLSTTTAHLENFHSYIVRSLLHPQGKHQEGNLFLKLFIRYLNQHYKTGIKEECKLPSF